MPQKLLYFPYALSPLQKMGSKAVPEAVRSYVFIYAGSFNAGFDYVPYAPGSKACPQLIKE